MQLPFGVIDADGHIIEDQARIRDYMPEPYNGFLMDNLPDSQGRVGHGSAITNRAFSDSTLGGRMGGLGPAGYPFPKDWLDALDWGGMEMTFLFPTVLLTYGTIWDPDYLKALTYAYNCWIADEWLSVSPKLKAVSLVPLTDVEAGTKEMRRTITESGFSGVMLPAVGFRRLRRAPLRPLLRRGPGPRLPPRRPWRHLRVHAIHQVHPAPHHRLPYLQHAADRPHGLRRSLRTVPDSKGRLPGDGLHLGPLLPRQDGRGMGESAAGWRPPTASANPASTSRVTGSGTTPNPVKPSSPKSSISSARTPFSTLPTGPTGTTNTPKMSSTSGPARTSPKTSSAKSSATTP